VLVLSLLKAAEEEEEDGVRGMDGWVMGWKGLIGGNMESRVRTVGSTRILCFGAGLDGPAVDANVLRCQQQSTGSVERTCGKFG
jgi:hypothetical protein